MTMQTQLDQRAAGTVPSGMIAIPGGVFSVLLGALLPLAAMAFSWTDWRVYAIGFGAAAIATAATYFSLAPKARRQTTEGFETADLKDARALLEELR